MRSASQCNSIDDGLTLCSCFVRGMPRLTESQMDCIGPNSEVVQWQQLAQERCLCLTTLLKVLRSSAPATWVCCAVPASVHSFAANACREILFAAPVRWLVGRSHSDRSRAQHSSDLNSQRREGVSRHLQWNHVVPHHLGALLKMSPGLVPCI